MPTLVTQPAAPRKPQAAAAPVAVVRHFHMTRVSARFADRWSIAALAIYAALSLTFFGRALEGDLCGVYLGRGSDASFLMWAISWWPYAIRHGLNPFLCRFVWAPSGFDLAWSGGMPLPALVAAPLTALVGPVATYNVIGLSAPAVAAWCAFLLCRLITGAWWPALIGGYLFGFSPYMLGQLIDGHLNLTLLFPIPLIVTLALLRLTEAITPTKFSALMTIAFVALFLCSIELAATTAIFGAVALVLGWWNADAAGRAALVRIARLISCSAAASLILLSIYLYYLFWPGVPHGAINSPGGYSADVANLLIPTRTVTLGSMQLLQTITVRFPGNLGERGAYLGLPVFFVICHYAWTRRRDNAAHFMIALLAVVTVCALGPRLRLAGWSGFAMPWKLMTHVPILKSALPARFMNYVFLATGVVVASWLADVAIPRRLRVIMTGLLIASLLPNLDASIWASRTALPQFFSAGQYAKALRRDETVVALPFGIHGNTMLWQAEAEFYFRLAGGYTGITPREFERWPIINALMTATLIPSAPSQLAAFMAAHGATTVIVDEAQRAPWSATLSALDPAPENQSGVWLYRPSPTLLARYRDASVLAMEQANAAARFTALVTAARDYLAAGNPIATLTPKRAQDLHLLPPDWVTDHDVRTNNGLYLGPGPNGTIAVGVVGSYEALQPLIEKYRSQGTQIFFPYPRELTGQPLGDTFMRLLVITFDPVQLSALAAAN
jgi:hypothetical protein